MTDIDVLLKLYDDQILKPEMGNGALRNKLKDGLESVLMQVAGKTFTIPKAEGLEVPITPPGYELIADKKIDYASILRKSFDNWEVNRRGQSKEHKEEVKGYARNYTQGVRRLLERRSIETYGDLLNYFARCNDVEKPFKGSQLCFTNLLYDHLKDLSKEAFGKYIPK